MALQQAHRAVRGTAQRLLREHDPLLRDTALVIEAHAVQAEVACTFPGLVPAMERLRRLALAARPPVAAFTPIRRPLESLARALLEDALPFARVPAGTVEDSLEKARQLIQTWGLTDAGRRRLGSSPLFRDWWTGELRAPEASAYNLEDIAVDPQLDAAPVRSAHMNRRPEEREATDDEDKSGDSAAGWCSRMRLTKPRRIPSVCSARLTATTKPAQRNTAICFRRSPPHARWPRRSRRAKCCCQTIHPRVAPSSPLPTLPTLRSASDIRSGTARARRIGSRASRSASSLRAPAHRIGWTRRCPATAPSSTASVVSSRLCGPSA